MKDRNNSIEKIQKKTPKQDKNEEYNDLVNDNNKIKKELDNVKNSASSNNLQDDYPMKVFNLLSRSAALWNAEIWPVKRDNNIGK